LQLALRLSIFSIATATPKPNNLQKLTSLVYGNHTNLI